MLPTAQPPKPPEPDFFSKVMKDPWFRLGMALLEQGGPKRQPSSVGQDIARAVESVQNQQDMDLVREERQMGIANERANQDWAREQLQRLTGAGQPRPPQMMAPGSQAPQPMPTAPQAALAPPPVASRIDPVANPTSDIKLSFKVPQQYEPMLRRASQMYGVPYELLAAQAQHESAGTWDPNVKGQMGEIGIPQFMPKTAREYGLIGADGSDNRNNPELSFNAQAKFMRDLYNRTGNWFDATHRYNASPNNPMGKRYANTVLGLAGMTDALPGRGSPTPAPAQSAPTSAPQPQSPAVGASQAPSTQLPFEVHELLLGQALAEGGNDPVKVLRSYERGKTQFLLNQMQNQSQQGADIFKIKEVERYKDDLGAARDKEKIKQEVESADEKKFQEGLGQQFSERYGEIAKAGTGAQAKIERLNLLQNLLGRVYTGAGGETVKDIVKIGAALGFEGLGEAASAADAANSIINQMALSFRSTANGEGMPGAMSDADRQFLMSLPPGFEKTPEGNRVLIEFYKRTAMREKEIARMARAYRKKNGRFDDDFEDEILTYNMNNPLFKDGEIQRMLGAKINPQHIQRLKANPTPEMKKMFDEAFGAGASERVLKGGQ